MFYGHNQARKLRYGLMYNGYASVSTGIAPSGWRVPSYNDFLTLITYLGGSSVAGGHMKDLRGWYAKNADNSSYFSALGSGARDYLNPGGNFYLRMYECQLITTSFSVTTGLIECLALNDINTIANLGLTIGDTVTDSLREGYSIRLIKNDSTNPGTITDYDGNEYNCVTIGSQVWIQQNWKCTHFNNGNAITQYQNISDWASANVEAYSIYNNDIKNV